jgi:hypothetical protein
MSFIESFREVFTGAERDGSISTARGLLAYCTEKHLSLNARLRLFDEVCDLVQANHAGAVFFRHLRDADIQVCDANGTRTIEISSETHVSPRRTRPAIGLSAATIAEAVDIWRLGELLSRVLADLGPMPPRLEDIVARTTSGGGTRTQSVFDLRAQIRAYVHGLPHQSEVLPPLESPTGTIDRHLTPLPV